MFLKADEAPLLGRRYYGYGIFKYGAVVLGPLGTRAEIHVSGTAPPEDLPKELRESADAVLSGDREFLQKLEAFLKGPQEDPWRGIFNDCVERGQLKDAEKVLKIAAKGAWISGEERAFLWAQAHFDNALFGEAETILAKVVKSRDPRLRLEGQLLLAEVWVDLGKFDEARKLLEKLAADNKTPAESREKTRPLLNYLEKPPPYKGPRLHLERPQE